MSKPTIISEAKVGDLIGYTLRLIALGKPIEIEVHAVYLGKREHSIQPYILYDCGGLMHHSEGYFRDKKLTIYRAVK